MTKPEWLQGDSNVDYLIAPWLSSGIMATVAKPGNAVLAELQEVIYEVMEFTSATARASAFTEVAAMLRKKAELYPTDIWLEDSTHPDAIAAKTLRLMLPRLADEVTALASQAEEK